MRTFTKPQKCLLLSIGLAVLGIHVFGNPYHFSSPSPTTPSHLVGGPWVVEVAGAVKNPGIFTFEFPPTRDQIIERALGLKQPPGTPLPDRSRHLETGTSLHVTSLNGSGSLQILSSKMDGCKRFVLGLPVNLNHASTKTLALIPGISASLAGRIVDFRQAHGPFLAWNALLEVKGVGPSKLKKLKEYLRIEL